MKPYVKDGKCYTCMACGFTCYNEDLAIQHIKDKHLQKELI